MRRKQHVDDMDRSEIRIYTREQRKHPRTSDDLWLSVLVADMIPNGLWEAKRRIALEHGHRLSLNLATAYFPLPTLIHAAPNYPSPPARQSLGVGSQNVIVVITGRIRNGAGDSTSTIWNDPQNRTRRELSKYN